MHPESIMVAVLWSGWETRGINLQIVIPAFAPSLVVASILLKLTTTLGPRMTQIVTNLLSFPALARDRIGVQIHWMQTNIRAHSRYLRARDC